MHLPLALPAPHSHAHLRPLQHCAIFRFLSLPVELRLQIYSYLFECDDLICTILSCNFPTFHAFFPGLKTLHFRLVCRQIHEETTDFIFKHLRVTIDIGWVKLLERRLTELTFLEANWKRIRSFTLHVRPVRDVDVTESQLVDVEKLLRKYFRPGEEGMMELKSLVVNVSHRHYWEPPPEPCCRAGVALTGDHPLLKWMDGIEGLRNTGWKFHFHEYRGTMRMCFCAGLL